MKQKAPLIALLAVILVVIGSVSAYLSQKQYASDPASMEAIIAGELGEPAEVFGTVQLNNGDIMLAGYLTGTPQTAQRCGYAKFQKSSPDSYELISLKKPEKLAERAQEIWADTLHYSSEKASYDCLVILSNHPKLSKVQLTIETSGAPGQVQKQDVSSCPAVCAIECPSPDSDYSWEYRFYDDDGNEIVL